MRFVLVVSYGKAVFWKRGAIDLVSLLQVY